MHDLHQKARERLRRWPPARTESSDEFRGWYSRGYLPHFDAEGVVQHITYHLGDSLPKVALENMLRELGSYPEDKFTIERRKRIQKLLDNGYGSCVLGRYEFAKIVEDSFLFGDGTRYRLLAWVVMPNHVHVLMKQQNGWPLAKFIQSWKRHTSRNIHLLSGSGQSGQLNCTLLPSPPPSPLWHHEYFDRFIRNEKHFFFAKNYIENNPVAAGLVSRAEDWRWSSAWSGRN